MNKITIIPYDALKYEMAKKLTNSYEIAKLESKRSNSCFIIDMKNIWDKGIVK